MFLRPLYIKMNSFSTFVNVSDCIYRLNIVALYVGNNNSSSSTLTHVHLSPQYQTMRGGRIVLQAVSAPAHQEWGSAVDGLTAALELEKQVNQVRPELPLTNI